MDGSMLHRQELKSRLYQGPLCKFGPQGHQESKEPGLMSGPRQCSGLILATCKQTQAYCQCPVAAFKCPPRWGRGHAEGEGGQDRDRGQERQADHPAVYTGLCRIQRIQTNVH